MPDNPDVQLAVETLLDMGVLDRDGLARLGQLFRGVQAIGGASAPSAQATRTPSSKPAGTRKKRGRRPRVEVTKDQMTSLVNQGLSNAQIAKELGCSLPTVYNKKKEFGLVKSRGGGKKKGKKKSKKKTGKKRTGKK